MAIWMQIPRMQWPTLKSAKSLGQLCPTACESALGWMPAFGEEALPAGVNPDEEDVGEPKMPECVEFIWWARGSPLRQRSVVSATRTPAQNVFFKCLNFKFKQTTASKQEAKVLQSGGIPFRCWHFNWDGHNTGQKAAIEGTQEGGRFAVWINLSEKNAWKFLKIYLKFKNYQCHTVTGQAKLDALFAASCWIGHNHLPIQQCVGNFCGTTQQFGCN